VTEAVARRPETPWLQRLCDEFAVAPVRVGAALAVGLSALFVAGELALGRHRLLDALPAGHDGLRDVRIAFVNFLLAGYAAAALPAVVRGARRRIAALRPLFDPGDATARALADGVGIYRRAQLRAAGLFGVGLGLLTPLLAEGAEFAYHPRAWSYEVAWHRLLVPFIGWWTGRFLFAVLAESQRLSRLAARLPAIDLFDLRPLVCFARQGLSNALLNVGFVSILALYLFESGFGVMFVLLGVMNLGVSGAGLLLPVRGVHLRIRAAKSAELDWCRERLREVRTQLAVPPAPRPGSGATEARLADLLAYRAFVEAVREWPFDASTLVRFGLYLLIPLGSWAGGALVERLIDALLG
jgi:hypothetical protein